MEEQPPASVQVNNPAMEADLRTASEAMQRAAEAMIAATESFRRQFHAQQGDVGDGNSPTRPYTYHAVESWPERRESSKRNHRASASGSILMSSSNSNSSRTTARDTVVTNGAGPLVVPRPSPPSGLGGIDSDSDGKRHRPERSRGQTPKPGFEVQVLNTGVSNGTVKPQLQKDTTPATDWPVTKGSPPPLTSLAHRYSQPVNSQQQLASQWSSPTHGHRSSAAHIDLVEAAERFKQNGYQPCPIEGSLTTPPPPVHQPFSSPPIPPQYQEQSQPRLQPHRPYQRPMIFHPPPPVPFSHPTDVNEPYPILQIGRHTYIRSGSSGSTDIVPTGPTITSSTDDFHTTLLTNQLRHPIHPLSRVHPSFRGPSATPPTRTKPPPQPSTAPANLSLPREILFVLLICLSQVLMLAGISQALVPQVLIGSSFPDTSPGSLAWYSASYGLTAGTFVLPAGRLGDLFGHKKIFIVGFFWFGAWSLAAGLAEMVQTRAGGGGTVFFCLCRAMQGVGPALLVPNGQAMLGRTYRPGKRKNVVMSLFGAAAPLGFVLGAVMSSLFAEKVGWPWGFWMMATVCAVLGVVSWGVIPGREEGDRGREREKEGLWTRLDGYGMGLGVSGLVLFNFAFNQAPIASWTTPYTYFILVIAVLLLAGFIYHELITPHPLVPIAAMRSQTNFVLGCTAAGWGCFSIWVYYALATLQNIRHWSPLLSSAAFTHAPVSGFVASMLTAYLMSRIKPHWIMFISMCAFFIGSILLATAPTDQLYWFNTFFGILVMPFGMDMSNPAATIILSNSVPKEHQGIAASLVVTVVNYSISLALGLGGTLEVNVNDGGRNLEVGYRGAQWLSVGLGGLGVVLAAAFLAQSYARERKSKGLKALWG